MKEGLDTTKIVETMSQPTRPTAPEESPIKNVKYVSSYNWIDKEKPTIAVPGATYISLLHISPFLTVNPFVQVPRPYGQGVPSHSR
jgi:hypothetical protein